MAEILLNFENFKHNLKVIREQLAKNNALDSQKSESGDFGGRGELGLRGELGVCGESSGRDDFRESGGKIAELALVLKDNAYGHGLAQTAQMAKACGIKNVFVKNFYEASVLQNLDSQNLDSQGCAHFQVALDSENVDFENICILYGVLENGQKLSPNMSLAVSDLGALDNLQKGDRVELKINTGMNRNGIALENLEHFISEIKARGLRFFGVLSHNGYGDDFDGDDFERCCVIADDAKRQILKICQKLDLPRPRFHFLSSSGALRCKNLSDDLVRIGIAAYGYLGCDLPISASLRPVLSLWAHKISTKILPKGAKIGYSGKSVLDESCEVSTYDIGYGDGLFRINERKNVFTAEGVRILPRSSMDCFSAISSAPKLCVFDNAQAIASEFDTISYEVLVRLNPFIKRRIV